jgi:2-dehydropantoate 2-reductase
MPIRDNNPMRILVIGGGAVGGYFGGRLAQAGKDVTFLVRVRHAQAIQNHGLRIVSPYGDVVLQPRLVLAKDISSPYDVVLLCVKAYSLQAAIDDFAAAVGPATMILPQLNGMRHIDLLVERFGEERVLGGVCMVAAEVDAEGRIVQLNNINRLIYGERNGSLSPRITALDEVMQGAIFEARSSDHILQEMWEKWVVLSSLGATTCLLRGNIGEITAVPGGSEITRAILAEASAIAAAAGYAPNAGFQPWADKILTNPNSTLTSSMYRDMATNAPVEVEQILGDLVQRGHAAGVHTPLLEAACANLRIYDARRLK